MIAHSFLTVSLRDHLPVNREITVSNPINTVCFTPKSFFIYHSFPTNSGQPIITVTQMGNLIVHFESIIFNLRDTMSIAVSPYFPFTALGWRIQCAVGEPHLSHIVSNLTTAESFHTILVQYEMIPSCPSASSCPFQQKASDCQPGIMVCGMIFDTFYHYI